MISVGVRVTFNGDHYIGQFIDNICNLYDFVTGDFVMEVLAEEVRVGWN